MKKQFNYENLKELALKFNVTEEKIQDAIENIMSDTELDILYYELRKDSICLFLELRYKVILKPNLKYRVYKYNLKTKKYDRV